MSTPIKPYPIALIADYQTPTVPLDQNRANAVPQIYRGDDIIIVIALAASGVLQTTFASAGAGGIASVTCQLFQTEQDPTPASMSQTVLSSDNTDMHLAYTTTNFPASDYFAQFIFTNAQTNLALGGEARRQFWLRIFITTTDGTPKQITICEGPFYILDAPLGTPGTSGQGGNVQVVPGANGTLYLALISDSDGTRHAIHLNQDQNGLYTLQVDQNTI